MNKKIFIERITFDVAEDEIYNHIRDLDYKKLMEFRDYFLLEATKRKIISDSEDAKKSFWKRLMSKFKLEYAYIKPVSTNKDALSKRTLRKK
jgi:hypothetical protein